MSRYEIKYNEKLLKHYFYDNELKEQISFDDVLKVIEEQNNQLAELQEKYDVCQEKLNRAIRFKTEHIERFAVVQYCWREKKPYKVVNCYDSYKDENMNIVPCFYNVDSTNFKIIKMCDTLEEAQRELEMLKGKKK